MSEHVRLNVDISPQTRDLITAALELKGWELGEAVDHLVREGARALEVDSPTKRV